MIIKTIWKYEFVGQSPATFQMPIGANVVRVAFQGRGLCLWACVVPSEEKMESREFLVTGTGHPVPMKAGYVGSVSDGRFEWHVWEA